MLMRAAQSEGLFCNAELALKTVKQHPDATVEEQLRVIRDHLRPQVFAQPARDPRTLSSQTLLEAATVLATAGSSSKDSPWVSVPRSSMVVGT